MIYQLKITLTGSIPVTWRRLQVSSHLTFGVLHEILQILFEWEGEHLHVFEITKTGGLTKRNQQITIGPTEGLTAEDTYPELDCILENWLTREKDTCCYIYDFGNYWQHEIVLERIIDIGEATYFYPICRKAVGEAPVDYIVGSRKIENDDLQKAINQQLKHLWEKLC
ncbi:plasmid pRiA4b ORF-3 family protein [Cytobacillus suaedae]|nr:plasmid pRiA4b ORF-3 family protein [Cytobacillus suaedae]